MKQKINNTTFNQTFLNVDNGVSGLTASSMTLASVNTLNNCDFEVSLYEKNMSYCILSQKRRIPLENGTILMITYGLWRSNQA